MSLWGAESLVHRGGKLNGNLSKIVKALEKGTQAFKTEVFIYDSVSAIRMQVVII